MLPVLVSLTCEFHTTYRHLVGETQQRNFLDQIDFWICLWGIA